MAVSDDNWFMAWQVKLPPSSAEILKTEREWNENGAHSTPFTICKNTNYISYKQCIPNSFDWQVWMPREVVTDGNIYEWCRINCSPIVKYFLSGS